jgi:hypothetical protein
MRNMSVPASVITRMFSVEFTLPPVIPSDHLCRYADSVKPLLSWRSVAVKSRVAALAWFLFPGPCVFNWNCAARAGGLGRGMRQQEGSGRSFASVTRIVSRS